MLRWVQSFNTDGESTVLAQMNAGTGSNVGVFSPPVDGTIRKIVVFVGYEAATSLVEDVRVEITSTEWDPNTLHFLAQGMALQTVPVGARHIFEYDVNLKMTKNTPLDGRYIHDSGTPVTSRIRVLIGFE